MKATNQGSTLTSCFLSVCFVAVDVVSGSVHKETWASSKFAFSNSVSMFLMQNLVAWPKTSWKVGAIPLTRVEWRLVFIRSVVTLVRILRASLLALYRTLGIALSVQPTGPPHHLDDPSLTKAANSKGRGKEKRKCWWEAEILFIGPCFSTDQVTCKLEFTRCAVMTPFLCCNVHIVWERKRRGSVNKIFLNFSNVLKCHSSIPCLFARWWFFIFIFYWMTVKL